MKILLKNILLKREKLKFSLILFLSILLSIYLLSQTYVISMDGAFQYIPIAKDFVSGFYKKALTHNQQPLYPFFIALFYKWTGDFEWAGKLVSFIFGILLIFPVYFLGKQMVDGEITFFSLFLLAIHPYIRRFSVDVLKESTYLFFYTMALWLSWNIVQNEKKYLYLFIPILSVLTYLVRPDGIEVLIVVFFYVLFFKRVNSNGERWKIIFILSLSSFFLFLPYLVHLKATTGAWTLSRAKTITWFLGLTGSGSEIPFTKKFFFALKDLNKEILSIFTPIYILLLFIGIWSQKKLKFKEIDRFFLLSAFLHYGVLFLLVLNLTEWEEGGMIRHINLSGRHALPLLIVSIYWIGEGMRILCDWSFKKIESLKILEQWEPKRRYFIVLSVLIILMMAIILPKTLKPQRYERLPEKLAGTWIKDQFGRGQKLFTTVPRVAYYAEGNYERIDLERDNVDKIMGLMRKNNAIFLILMEKEIFRHPNLVHTISKEFKEIKQFSGKGMDTVLIFRKVN